MSVPAVGFLPLRVELRADLVVPVPNDPARRVSATSIPGRTFQGMLAAALVRTRPHRLLDLAIRGEALQFGPGHPLASIDRQDVPTWPAPLSWHVDARASDATAIIDLLGKEQPPTRPVRQIRSLLTAGPGGNLIPIQVRSTSHTHVQRSRTFGTATTTTGGPYEVVALRRGQQFLTLWRLEAADPSALNALHAEILDLLAGTSHRIGSAVSRYGGDPVITPLRDHLDPSDGGQDPLHIEAGTHWAAGEDRDLLLLSPTLVRDPATGNPRPGCLPDLVVEMLTTTGEGPAVTVVGSWIEQHRYGGYNRHYRGYVAESWAATPGSVVRLRATRVIPREAVTSWLRTPIGARTVEGCGRHILLPVGGRLILTAATATALSGQPNDTVDRVQLPDGSTQPFPHPVLHAVGDIDVTRLQHQLLTAAAAPLLRAHARTLPVPRPGGDGPSRHLYGRLSDLLTQTRHRRGAAAALTALSAALTGAPFVGEGGMVLAEKALKDLSVAVTPGSTLTATLQDLASTRGQGWTSFVTTLNTQLDRLVLAGWRTLDGKDATAQQVIDSWVTDTEADLAAALLHSYLTRLRRAGGVGRETSEDPT
jgi:hypothetical protein